MGYPNKILLCCLLILTVAGSLPAVGAAVDTTPPDISQFMAVDCLLPSQIRRLGSMTYAAARKAIKTSAGDCERRGGEYVAFDRASHATTLKVWMPLAEQGDPKAQTYVGETYEKGQGVEPDYGAAAFWYLKAAEQEYSRAAVNLGNLFEQGLGVARDPAMARFWYQQASASNGLPRAEQAQKPAAKILIIEPQLNQRGLKIIHKQQSDSDAPMLVIGQVQSEIPLHQVLLNNTPASLVGDGLFRGNVSGDVQQLLIEAIDKQNNKTQLSLTLVRDGGGSTINPAEQYQQLGMSLEKPARKNKYHALLIGNNSYQHLPLLNTAVNDVKVLAQVLEQEYGFTTSLIQDGNRYQVLSALNDLRETFDHDTRLLVYYAGHGELDRVNNRGHWLPTDAEPNSQANWISNIAISDMLNLIPARQLLVIADSCYSGMMSRSALGLPDPSLTQTQQRELLHAMTGSRTRVAFTSGGVAPVLDSAGDNHSVFAQQLIMALQHNSGAVTGYQLFEAITPLVQENAEKVGFRQQPEYAPLKFAGHEAGDFVFYKTNLKGAAHDKG